MFEIYVRALLHVIETGTVGIMVEVERGGTQSDPDPNDSIRGEFDPQCWNVSTPSTHVNACWLFTHRFTGL